MTKTSVYTYRAQDGEILYVGMSVNPFSRAGQHGLAKDMEIVTSIDIEWCESRAEAKEIERRKISTLNPRWNVKLTGKSVSYCGKENAGPPTQKDIERDDEDLRRVLANASR